MGCDFRLRHFVQPMEEKNEPASLRQRLNHLLKPIEQLHELNVSQTVGFVQSGIRRYGDRNLPAVQPVGGARQIDRAVRGCRAKKSQRGDDRPLWRVFDQAHANVVHHLVREAPTTETPTYVIDQFVVMTNQCSNQR